MRTDLAALVVLAFGAVSSAQTTWFVDAAATPPGDGSAGAPFQSIQYALERPATVAGDTLAVAPGTYVENLVLNKRVTIAATGGAERTTLRNASPAPLVCVSAPDEYPFATLRGFTLDGSSSPAATGIHVQGAFAVLQLERSVVRGFSAGRGVFLDATSYLEGRLSTFALNGIGIEVRMTVSTGVATLIGCVLRHNASDFVGPLDGIQAMHSNLAAPLAAVSGAASNVTTDPQLWYVAAGDLHLRPGSPCVNSAGASFPLDPDGSPADMGAFPLDPTHGWTSYCTSGTTSSGCVPTISAAGVPSVLWNSGFTISVSSVEGLRQGHVFYGLSGPHASPWGTSSHFLCVKSPTQRTGTQDSGGSAGSCDGTIALDWNAYVATHPTALGVPFAAGTEVRAQLFFRDPPTTKTTALSDALQFAVVP